MSKVLTSLEREFDLPLKKTELKENEEVVATDAPLGMLNIKRQRGISVLEDIDTNKKQTNIICLPNYKDYYKEKELRKNIILDMIEKKS